MRNAPASKRRSVNLTISEDVIKAAKALNLNASQAAEAGIVDAIRRAREEEWLKGARPAIAAHNARVEREGTLLTPAWLAPESDGAV